MGGSIDLGFEEEEEERGGLDLELDLGRNGRQREGGDLKSFEFRWGQETRMCGTSLQVGLGRPIVVVGGARYSHRPSRLGQSSCSVDRAKLIVDRIELILYPSIKKKINKSL